MAFAIASLLALSAAFPTLAALHEVWWNIEYVENVNPDGLFARRVIGVNGSWPPPPVDIKSTDLLKVHVTNSLDTPTSLHHHGMLFKSMPWMDGVKGLTECGIPPGGSFEYVVPINSSGQSGSYWVHAHSKGQYVDGLRAPLIIHAAEQSTSYDDDYTVVLGDWYHEEHPQLMKRFLSPSNPDGVEPVPDSALVYFAHSGAYLGPKGSNSLTSAVGFNENATLPFEPGKTYLLRLINTSAFAMFYFWIDGHDMKIVEVDGVEVEEMPVATIGLAVAQRYSVLITARNESSSNWAVHANMDTSKFDYVPDSLNPNVTSSITYNLSALAQDDGPISEYIPIDDMTLVPRTPLVAPEPSRTIVLGANLDVMDDGTNRGLFNMVTYNYPLVPGLFSSLTLAENATTEYAYGPSSLLLNHMEVVDIVIHNEDDGDHPFHLHGHVPMLVGREDPKSVRPFSEANLTNPMRRDTFHIPGNGNITLRVVADNPGVWFLHCHMEWHLEAGLAIQFIEAPLEVQALGMAVPSKLYDNCKQLGIPYSGNAAGHASATDLSGLPLGPYPRQQKKWSILVQYLGFEVKGFIARWCLVVSPLALMFVLVYHYRIRPRSSVREEELKKDAKV